MCMIAYIAAPGGEESFYISTTPTNPIRNRAGESGCIPDYINIPNGNQPVSDSLSSYSFQEEAVSMELVTAKALHQLFCRIVSLLLTLAGTYPIEYHIICMSQCS